MFGSKPTVALPKYWCVRYRLPFGSPPQNWLDQSSPCDYIFFFLNTERPEGRRSFYLFQSVGVQFLQRTP
jgi:hypothetical protein